MSKEEDGCLVNGCAPVLATLFLVASTLILRPMTVDSKKVVKDALLEAAHRLEKRIAAHKRLGNAATVRYLEAKAAILTDAANASEGLHGTD